MREHSPRASRRTFLLASGFGLAGAGSLNSAATAANTKGSSVRAKSTILFFLCGGASHVDTWDMKPNARREYRGEFSPIATSAPGVHLCEHLPLLSEQAHHLAVVNSVGATVNTNDHHAGYYHNLTGHVPDRTFRTLGNNRTPFPDDWPFMGSVVAAKRPRHPTLTNAITLPYKPSRAPYTRPGQFAGRLGVQHDPLYVLGQLDAPLSFRAPALELATGTDERRLHQRRHLLDTIDSARRRLDTEGTRVWSEHRERAFSLLASSTTARAFVVPLVMVGGFVGRAIASHAGRDDHGVYPALLLLPVMAGVEAYWNAPGPEQTVLTTVEIDAPPEIVWQRVVSFPDLPPPEEFYFRSGIACPLRARIVGEGVGAVRHCEFTTGDFVEPITVWDEPSVLAFDVAEQPHPMFEVNPFGPVHPPHLEQLTLRSRRGEFRLVALPDGRTRLEGRTWYTFDMHPRLYWTRWSEFLIGRIHERVLTHVKRLAEDDAAKS